MMSSVMPNHDDPRTAARAGADLRAARERLGWDLAEIAAELRIRQPHLEALEDGRIDLLPGPAYALGFLRAYAASLGLDPDEIARRFKAEAGEVNARGELAFPAPVPERGIPAGAVVLLGLVLAIGAYAGWYHLSGEGRLPAETTAIPERLAPLAQQALPPVAPLAAAPRTVSAVPAPEPAPTSALAAEPPPPVPSISPSSAAAAGVMPVLSVPQGAPSAPAALTQAAQTLPVQNPPAQGQPASPATGTQLAASGQPHVVLRASADAWVQVREKSGQVLLNRILHAGDTWPVPDRPDLLLTTGNAGGTELVVDGVSTGALGNSGAVRRDLPLDPTLIKAGRLNPPAVNGVERASLGVATP